LPLPASATAAQPPMDAPLSVKATVPVGDEPVTLAVKVALDPCVAGFADVESVVVVDVALPGEMTCTLSAVGVAEVTFTVIG